MTDGWTHGCTGVWVAAGEMGDVLGGWIDHR